MTNASQYAVVGDLVANFLGQTGQSLRALTAIREKLFPRGGAITISTDFDGVSHEDMERFRDKETLDKTITALETSETFYAVILNALNCADRSASMKWYKKTKKPVNVPILGKIGDAVFYGQLSTPNRFVFPHVGENGETTTRVVEEKMVKEWRYVYEPSNTMSNLKERAYRMMKYDDHLFEDEHPDEGSGILDNSGETL